MSSSRDDQLNARSARWIIVAGLVVAAAAIVSILQLWSECEIATSDDAPDEIELSMLWLIEFTVSRGTVVLIVVAIGGVLGGTLTGLRNAATYRGLKTFERSWTTWYVIRPFLGAGIALVLYLTLMGGLLGVGAGDAEVNKFGVTALAVLSGMFSKNAIEKLAELFNNIFATSQQRDQDSTLKVRLEELAALHESGTLDAEEFAQAKANLLAPAATLPAPPAPDPEGDAGDDDDEIVEE